VVQLAIRKGQTSVDETAERRGKGGEKLLLRMREAPGEGKAD
jgi:hypothetical protein